MSAKGKSKKPVAEGAKVESAAPAKESTKKPRLRGRARAEVVVNGPQSGKPPTLSAGTVLTRTYKGKRIAVKVLGPKQFEYQEKIYTSLSALANAITGGHHSGNAWFGLKPRAQKAKAKK